MQLKRWLCGTVIAITQMMNFPKKGVSLNSSNLQAKHTSFYVSPKKCVTLLRHQSKKNIEETNDGNVKFLFYQIFTICIHGQSNNRMENFCANELKKYLWYDFVSDAWVVISNVNANVNELVLVLSFVCFTQCLYDEY